MEFEILRKKILMDLDRSGKQIGTISGGKYRATSLQDVVKID
jgi:hypothetical protein